MSRRSKLILRRRLDGQLLIKQTIFEMEFYEFRLNDLCGRAIFCRRQAEKLFYLLEPNMRFLDVC
jgi:hypothetical protein